ncbi:hypothetical protein PCANC_19546 [Puccinia coronata f. sp. avenae]|uniref:DNA/pantothenate metabolism flavoprotein C-terminal domain-containing protein n=1 Tax=Puccinia coronata f. sp. avenae TaxID=200324 RepID=A0A2N5TQ71_9BASI|nr:hypothetical protein PCASD_21505 [Puccinia coronata f. sp. avenae]PLW09244.1 hypothetical protein PCANC_19973 [Puccinia coronata f. sp. avenae]PLW27645.1 hypothetical protein PCANC_19546 [Puccinia coronata f. sp. avenae]
MSAFSSDRYFKTQSPPSNLEETVDRVRRFVHFHANRDPARRIVLITSGGTTVPLEHNVVRFLDNFSAGTRGSASAEAFLRTNQYAVIFLHRSHSLEPFSRHYPHSTNPFLDLLAIQQPSSQQEITSTPESPLPTTDHHQPLFPILSPYLAEPSVPSKTQPESNESKHVENHQTISIPHQYRPAMLSILKAHHLVHQLNLLHTISFVTVNEYLYLLRAVAQVLGEPSLGLGRRAMLYLAAAVSDFFIPQQKLSEHKIQSGKGSLVIEMDAVPKVLKDVTNEWSNQAFIVSFKLETDMNLLIPKAKAALTRYGHHLVIANELHTRKTSVLLIDRDGEIEEIKNDEHVGYEIEEQMVHRLVHRHLDWIKASPTITSPSPSSHPSS